MVDTSPALRDLALAHGLTAAGARPRLPHYVRTLWSYRHFTVSYANAKLTASYSTARLGQLWQVLTPLTNAAVYYLIFGVILNTRAGVDNFIAYLCTGLFIFTFTQTVVQQATQSISSNLGLIRSLHFPRACLPIAVMITQLRALVAAISVLIGMVLLTREPITWEWLLLVPTLLLQALFNAGLAMVVARLGARMTDLKQVMPFIMRTWMYASGVLYSVENFEKHLPPTLATIVEANPLLVYIELARYALLDGSPVVSPLPQLWLLAVGWAAVVGVGGFIYFWHGERDYGRG